MTTDEVFTLITSEPKWYGGKMTRQLASRIVKRHKAGHYNNYKWFFEKFGYTIMQKELWTHEK